MKRWGRAQGVASECLEPPPPPSSAYTAVPNILFSKVLYHKGQQSQCALPSRGLITAGEINRWETKCSQHSCGMIFRPRDSTCWSHSQWLKRSTAEGSGFMPPVTCGSLLKSGRLCRCAVSSFFTLYISTSFAWDSWQIKQPQSIFGSKGQEWRMALEWTHFALL